MKEGDKAEKRGCEEDRDDGLTETLRSGMRVF